ncbi:MAG: DNA replication/repair protein RecF [Succinivibrio sp.]
MYLKKIVIQNIRNLPYIDYEPSKSFNLVYGPNGSGKTSFLEAISYLGYGRSFRESKYQNLISSAQPYFSITANIANSKSAIDEFLGICRYRNRNQDLSILINSTKTKRLSDLVDRVSIQVIHPQGIDLVLLGPDLRRSFVDWGVYYSYPQFKELWSTCKRLLSQRNSLLRSKSPADMVQLWDEQFCHVNEEITRLREEYISGFKEVLLKKLALFLPDFSFEISFSKGWGNGLPLRSVLDSNLEKDRVLGYTFYGCHRADLKIKCNGFYSSETLSRGQLKLLVCALKLAQGSYLFAQTGRKSIYLIDDLSSELDSNSRNLLLEDLCECDFQVFITNISSQIDFEGLTDCKYLNMSEIESISL